MHALLRVDLPGPAEDYLRSLQSAVDGAAAPKVEAATIWKTKSRAQFEIVRTALRGMASGRMRCMYCEDSLATDIDHFAPKASHPQVAFQWLNYLLACSHCNSNEKRNRFPVAEDGRPLLIDPTVDDPLEHLALLPHLGEFAARSQRGSASIEVFGLNRHELITGRFDAWISLESLVVRYAELERDGKSRQAESVREAVRGSAFRTVAAVMRTYAFADIELLRDEVRGILNEFPDLVTLD